jgi:hypothetical protein
LSAKPYAQPIPAIIPLLNFTDPAWRLNSPLYIKTIKWVHPDMPLAIGLFMYYPLFAFPQALTALRFTLAE